jgi:hypothetical protein
MYRRWSLGIEEDAASTGYQDAQIRVISYQLSVISYQLSVIRRRSPPYPQWERITLRRASGRPGLDEYVRPSDKAPEHR